MALFLGPRRAFIVAAFLVAAIGIDTAAGNGLRSNKQQQQGRPGATTTPSATTAIPPLPQAASAAAAPVDLKEQQKPIIQQAAPAPPQQQQEQNPAAPAAPVEDAIPAPPTIDTTQIDREALKSLHEDMVIDLMSDSSHRQAFVAQGDAGGRRLQFGIPGVGIPGVGGIGNVRGISQGINSAIWVARAGTNALRQGVATAQQLDQARREYEKRCNLVSSDAEMHPHTRRHLQQLLNQGVQYYSRTAECPTAEERQQYLDLKNHAAKLVSEKAEVQIEQEQRILLQREARGETISSSSSSSGGGVHRETIARYPRILQQDKKPMPSAVSGVEIAERQKRLSEADLDDYDGYDQDDEDEGGNLGPFLMMAGETREGFKSRREAHLARIAARKAAKQAKRAARLGRFRKSPSGHWP